jgi:hypothetical protein
MYPVGSLGGINAIGVAAAKLLTRNIVLATPAFQNLLNIGLPSPGVLAREKTQNECLNFFF